METEKKRKLADTVPEETTYRESAVKSFAQRYKMALNNRLRRCDFDDSDTREMMLDFIEAAVNRLSGRDTFEDWFRVVDHIHEYEKRLHDEKVEKEEATVKDASGSGLDETAEQTAVKQQESAEQVKHEMREESEPPSK